MSKLPLHKRLWRRSPWYRINILEEVSDKKELRKARKSTGEHPEELLELLRYTEKSPAWALLFKHMKAGQIRPWDVRHMKREDLEYVAGMGQHMHDFTDSERAKAMENVARASRELHNRQAIRVAVYGVSATLFSVLITFLLTKYLS